MSIAFLIVLWVWAYYHHVMSSRCYRRIELAEMAIEKLPPTKLNRDKVAKLIDRASQYSYNRSTEKILQRTVEKFNRKFLKHAEIY
jgi:hypothetical protein